MPSRSKQHFKSRALSETEHTLALADREVRYTLKRMSQRKRSIALKINRSGKITVLAPADCPDQTLQRFLDSRRAWLSQQLNNPWIDNSEDAGNAAPEHYLFGHALESVLSEEQLKHFGLRSGSDSKNEAASNSPLWQWYREQAMQALGAQLLALTEEIPWLAEPPPWRLRRMRRRWGSCNSRGEICLNTRLVQLPPELARMVIAHELCHVKEMNHSKAFYALLTSIVPEHRALDRHLKDWEARLLPR